MFDNFFNKKVSVVCPECEMNHDKDVKQKERTQERIRLLREAVRLLCEEDKIMVNEAMANAEKSLYGKPIDL